MTTIGLGLLGVGEHATRNLLPAFAETPEVRLVGVAGRDPARLAGLALNGARIHAAPEALIDDPEVQVVYVAVPTGLHAHWAAKVLGAGKHVFCEKSLTSTPEDGAELVELSRKGDLVLAETWMFRYHPQFERVRALIAEGAVGEVRSLTARFGFPHLKPDNVRYDPALGGGALLDTGGYPISAARLLIGADPLTVQAVIQRDDGFAVDTAGSALLHYRGGEHAHLEWGFGRHYRNEIEVWGDAASLFVTRAFSKPATLATVIQLQDARGERREIPIPPANHFVRMLRSFTGALDDGALREELRREIEQQQALLFAVARQGSRTVRT